MSREINSTGPLPRYRLFSPAQFLGFACAGSLGTAMHFGALIFLVSEQRWSPTLATAIGALLGATINFLLNHHLIFASQASYTSTAPRFFLIAIAGILINPLAMHLLTALLGIHYLAAQALTTASILVCNYLLNAIWTFGATRENT